MPQVSNLPWTFMSFFILFFLFLSTLNLNNFIFFFFTKVLFPNKLKKFNFFFFL